MSDGNYVAMLACPICQQSTELIIDTKMRPVFENREVVDPRHVCPDCREKYLKVGTMLINPETLSIVVIVDDMFTQLFGRSPPSQKIAFADEDVIQWIIHQKTQAALSYWHMGLDTVNLPDLPGVSSNYDICKFRWRQTCSKLNMTSEHGPIQPAECARCKRCEVF